MYTDKKQFKEYLSCNPEFSLSDSSIRNYIYAMEKFFKEYAEFSQGTINNYYMELKETRKPSYVNGVLSALRVYNKFKKTDFGIPKNVTTIKDDTKEIVSYDYLFNDIFDAIEYNDWHNKLQVKAVLVFMFYTGLRLHDNERLERKNFVFKKYYGYVTVYIQKNKFQKKVFFPKKAFKYIVEYFNTSNEEENAFNLKPTTIRNIFMKLNTLVSDKHLHPHMMRASAINYLYHECEWTVEQISKLIGITPQVIIKHYLRVSMDDIENKYAEKMRNK